MARIIAITNKKGGVGKTTSAVNLTASLAANYGKKVLLVDFDSQANATTSCGVHKPKHTIYSVLCGKASTEQAIVATSLGFDLLASELNLTAFESEAPLDNNRLKHLQNALQSVRDRYDYIIIDTPPELSILTNNALAAADAIAIPVQAEIFSIYGLVDLLKAVELFQSNVNKKLEIAGAFMTMSDNRIVCKKAHQTAKGIAMAKGMTLCDTIIKRNARLAEAPDSGTPAVLVDKKTPAVQAYHDLAAELFPELLQSNS
jgi:chromosome partitioning protein